jgi:hypothetical protein
MLARQRLVLGAAEINDEIAIGPKIGAGSRALQVGSVRAQSYGIRF